MQRSWIIGGTTLVGIGIGLVLLQTSALWFVASILIGIGLGLAIARDIARTHGGDITLETSQLGGLLAKIQIPL